MERLGITLDDADDVDARIPAGSGSPPRWAQREGDQTLVVTDEDEGLPGWVKDGLKRAAPAFGLDLTSQEQLPSWARDDQGTLTLGHPSDASVGALLQTPGEEASVQPSSRKPPEERLPPEQLPAAGAGVEPPEEGLLHTRPVDGKHVSHETEEEESAKPMMKLVEGQHVSKQTQDEVKVVESKKAVAGVSITQESTEEAKLVSKKKTVEGKSMTVQSTEESRLVHQKKAVAGKHMSVQSKQETKQTPSVKMSQTQHASVESAPVDEKPKRRNFFGHVSEMSGVEYEMLAPRLKRPPVMVTEDRWCYQIKPNRRRKSGKEEDEVDSEQKTTVTMNKDRYATKESEYVDVDQIRTARFRIRNIHGHASDSSVQKLLYPLQADSKEVDDIMREIGECLWVIVCWWVNALWIVA